jgi:hypothetical protein
MVTGNADREGFKSRKDLIGDGRWFVDASRQQILVRYERVQGSTPGDLRPRRASHRDCAVTREVRQLAYLWVRALGQV